VRKTYPEANGATFGVFAQSRANECYAEFGMTGSSANNTDWVTCQFGVLQFFMEGGGANHLLTFVHVLFFFS
jgi:hypothetical protein